MYMDYQKVYNSIVERGQVREPEGYYEVHHIVPKCMGGSNEPENLTKLTAREHFIAHWLLARIYSDNKGILYSFWMMCNMSGHRNRTYTFSSRVYEEARDSFCQTHSVLMKDKMFRYYDDPDIKRLHSEKVKHSLSLKGEEYLEKRSKWSKKLWEDPVYKEKQSAKSKKMWERQDYRENYSKARAKLTDAQVKEIKKLLEEGIAQNKISKMYSVSRTTIVRIKSGKIYKWTI
jgi:hypothetical protein